MWKASGTVTWTVSTLLRGCSLGTCHLSVSLTSWGSVLTCPFVSPGYIWNDCHPMGESKISIVASGIGLILKAGPRAQGILPSLGTPLELCGLRAVSHRKQRERTSVLNASLTPSFSRQQFPLWNLWFRFQTRHSRRQVQIGQSLVKMPTCLSCENWVRAESGRAGTEHKTTAPVKSSVFHERGSHGGALTSDFHSWE